MGSRKTKQSPQTCDRHRDEPIMVFSLKHEKSMCLKCAMTEHDQIADFVPVSEGARMMKAQGNKLLEEIRSTENIIKHIKQDKNRYLEKLRESERLVKDGIKNIRDTINKTLNKLESKAMGNLKQLVKSKETKFGEYKHAIYGLEDDLKSQFEHIRNSLKLGNDLDIISTVIQQKNLFQGTKLQVKDKQSNVQTDKVQFRTAPAITTFLENVRSLGEIKCVEFADEKKQTETENNVQDDVIVARSRKIQSIPPRRETPDGPSRPHSTRSQRHARFSRFHHGYEVRPARIPYKVANMTKQDDHVIMTAEHDGPCNHTGVAALSSGHVVICDARHKCLQLISKDSYILDDIIFQCKPSDVTTVSEHDVAVSFQEKDYISLFRISSHSFLHVKDLSVQGRGGSYSIAYARNKFAVCRRGEIRIISEDGTLRSIIQIEAHYPQIALGESENKIYLSDFVSGKIICLTETGKTRWEYSRETLEPTGIAIDLNQLYVADVSGRILVLSTYGILVREIDCPGHLNTICVDQNTGILLATQESKDKAKSRSVKIVAV